MWQLLVRKSRALVCSAWVVRAVQRGLGGAYVVDGVVGFGSMLMVLSVGEVVFEGIKMPLSWRSMWVVLVMRQYSVVVSHGISRSMLAVLGMEQ